MSVTEETWGRWNGLTGEERMMYVEHARQLVDRGYIHLLDDEDEFDLALRCFEAKLRDERKDQSPQKERGVPLP